MLKHITHLEHLRLWLLRHPLFIGKKIQKKQLEEQIEDLELQLKGLIIHNPLLQKVEQDTLASFSNEDDEDGKL